jgi:twitching motility protein PilT
VFRIIKGELSDLDQLGLPEVVKRFGDFRHGLVLFGGPTGSGKSTSLAAIIDNINRTSDRHVIALEDPIEVVHESKRGLVNQREIGTHTQSFKMALRSTLRQDPDVILVGEMRDLETIAFAVTAAETGHLIFGTVHTANAHSSVDRLINNFPAAEQDQVRATLADNLRAVVCQYLLRRKDGQGRTLAAEVMINNDAIASMIRKGKTYQIPSVIATSAEQGMQSMDNQLLLLCRKGVISAEEAYMKANVKKDFEELFEEEKKRPDEQVAVARSLSDTTGAAAAADAQTGQRQRPARAQ